MLPRLLPLDAVVVLVELGDLAFLCCALRRAPPLRSCLVSVKDRLN
jgi:hypothetical protein